LDLLENMNLSVQNVEKLLGVTIKILNHFKKPK
jgi:hypothetical protein